MEDFLYAYNQPVVNAKYDLILDGKIIANEVVTKSGSIGGGEDTSNYVKINDPITITEGDNTTSITSDTISTTTLSGTLDAESMKNSLTAEAIQAVMPVAWSNDSSSMPSVKDSASLAIGHEASAQSFSLSIGEKSVGLVQATTIGHYAKTIASFSTALGYGAITKKELGLTIGNSFNESTDSGKVTHTCTTEGTGSITIGAGANTLNTTTTVDGVETTVESSNSVTIGCKAENKGADSVVIGASATGSGSAPCVVLGAGSKGSGKGYCVAIGTLSEARDNDIAIGHNSIIQGGKSIGIGYDTKNDAASYTTILGAQAKITNTAALDGTVTKSENSTVIGYGAKACAPNAVVLGTGAVAGTTNTFAEKTVTIGVGAETLYREAIAIGHNAKSVSFYSIGLGGSTIASGNGAFALGFGAQSDSTYSTAIGTYAKAKNDGVVVFASFDNASMTTKTQLYFSGANTPLANEYYNGEAMMGYTVTDSAGTVLACGTRRLSELFPDNSLT